MSAGFQMSFTSNTPFFKCPRLWAAPGRQKLLFAPSHETSRWASIADDTLTDLIQERVPEEEDGTAEDSEPCLTRGC